MKIKKMFLIIIMIIFLAGCTKLDAFSYDELINMFSAEEKTANTFKKGYKFYVPKGLSIKDAGSNYVVISSNNIDYYLYVDLVSYNEKKELSFEKQKDTAYSRNINYKDKEGYIEINLWENNQYLIEIIYNYAKIEVMVDESMINNALANSINILNSIKYDDTIIKNILEQDDLTFKEEVFDMFEETEDNSNYLDYENIEESIEDKEDIKDTDYIN